MEQIEKKISGETIFEGVVFKIERDIVDCGDGRQAERELVRHNGGVGILAVDENDRAVMVRQFRYGAGKVLLEIPAGKLELGEDPAAACARELSEETGFTPSEIIPLGIIYPTCAYNTETIYLYLARNLTEGEPHPDEGEYVTAEKMPIAELEKMVLSGEITDAKTICALYRYRLSKTSQ